MPSTLDLFAGAGGLSLGFQHAGFDCIGAVEADRFAAATYRWNFPDVDLKQAKLEELSDSFLRRSFKGVDVVIGGPPCQGFSVAGPLQYGRIDARNELLLQVARVLRATRPRLVVLENVRGILREASKEHPSVYREYCRILASMGYETRHFILQAAEFGVPQYRERAFLLSSLVAADLPATITGARRSHDRWRCTWDALSDLPRLADGAGSDDPIEYTKPAQSGFQRMMRRSSPGVQNHVAMRHTQRVLERFGQIGPGQSILHVDREFGQRARGSHAVDARPRFKMNNMRLRDDCVSPAVTGNFQATHLHPYFDRVLTAREGARLQSFPDGFRFIGPRTLMSVKLLEREERFDEIGLSQYKQIGNAVPPLMAAAVAKKLARIWMR